jgi:hypothetical protein
LAPVLARLNEAPDLQDFSSARALLGELEPVNE